MIAIHELIQKDRCHFEIKWSDEKVQLFKLSDIQRVCPCASCKEREKKVINPDVSAIKLMQVGAYAIKIKFTEGCSQGIYPFTLLRKIEL